MRVVETHLRLFIAAPLAPGFDSNLSEVQAALSVARTRVKWVKPSDMHITVKFIGDYPAGQLDDVLQAMDDAVKGLEPTRLTLKGVSFFPRKSRPRVIKIAVKDETEFLLQAHERLEEFLQPLGVRGENKRFSPHITLGRLKNTADLDRLVGMAEEFQDEEFGSMDLSFLRLYASKLSRTGPTYTVIDEAFVE